jgi:hypothetical protein
MSKEPSQVEVPVCNTTKPIPNTLARYTGTLARSRQRGSATHVREGSEDVGYAVDLAG